MRERKKSGASLRLSDKYSEFLEELVSSGEYGSKTEILEAGLDLLMRERALKGMTEEQRKRLNAYMEASGRTWKEMVQKFLDTL